LVAQTCNGNDTFCDNITIVTPSKPGYLDYTADNVRPNVLDVVSFTTKTDYANQFEWSIFPTSFSYQNGTSASSQNPQIKFLKGGAYTFTLKAWNSVGGDSATQKKLIKNKYVIVLDYCTPLVSLLAADVGINSVVLENANGKKLIDNQSGSGQQAYEGNLDNAFPPVLTFGSSYDLTVERLTNSNNVNFKAWVDWNIEQR
jgi:PKD repeat protein